MEVRTELLDRPVSLPSALPPSGGYLWMRGGEGIAGWGEAARIDVPAGPGRFERAAAALDEAFAGLGGAGSGAVAFGSFTFDEQTEGSALVIPRVLIRTVDGRSSITTVGEVAEPRVENGASSEHHDFKIRYAGSTVSELEWLDIVARAVKALKGEELEKVVLARDIHVWSKQPFDLSVLLDRLAARFPECYTFACDGLVGATPELLIGKRGNKISSLVLAGTAARGDSEDEDARIGAGLLASSKDLSEHAPALTSVERVLRPLCEQLEVGAEPFLLKLANLQHLGTWLEGTLSEPVSSLRLAGRLHPTAAVCGTPTSKAMELIRDLEGMDRGRYAGPVGWVDAAGDGEWGIALRCAEFTETRGRLYAGGGIVAGSRPEAELEETRIKFEAIRAALEAR